VGAVTSGGLLPYAPWPMLHRASLATLLLAACAGVAPTAPSGDATPRDVVTDAGGPEASADVTREDDDAGATVAVALDYGQVDCVAVEAVAFNDGGVRQNEICDRGRLAASRYATVRDCAAGLTGDAALVRRIADDGAYMNPTRHPGATRPPCARFTVLYPVEQVQRALWCLRHAGRCADDGSPQ